MMKAKESLPKIEVISQEIGWILLNLFNNMFYALQSHPPPPAGGEIKNSQTEYKPTVVVNTSFIPPMKVNIAVVVVSVADNNPDNPKSIKDKIFQSFFTIKPTGYGPGAELSLSCAIVKAHVSDVKVEIGENEK